MFCYRKSKYWIYKLQITFYFILIFLDSSTVRRASRAGPLLFLFLLLPLAAQFQALSYLFRNQNIRDLRFVAFAFISHSISVFDASNAFPVSFNFRYIALNCVPYFPFSNVMLSSLIGTCLLEYAFVIFSDLLPLSWKIIWISQFARV